MKLNLLLAVLGINLDPVVENPIDNPTKNPIDNPIKNLTQISSDDALGVEGQGLQGLSLFIHYLFLSLGAFCGFIIISIEKADNDPGFDFFPDGETKGFIARIQSIRKIFWIRLLIILITINIFRLSALDSLGSTKYNNELINAAINFITQGISGSFIGGLILTVILLKFISFTD